MLNDLTLFMTQVIYRFCIKVLQPFVEVSQRTPEILEFILKKRLFAYKGRHFGKLKTQGVDMHVTAFYCKRSIKSCTLVLLNKFFKMRELACQ